jgi:hypothetical protein
MPRFPSFRWLVAASALAVLLAVVPVPAVALGPPETLAAARALGPLAGTTPTVDPSFTVDYLSVSWLAGDPPEVRFRDSGGWTAWTRVELDDIQTGGGRTYSSLISAGDAGTYQVRGNARGVEALALNTTDGPRPLVWQAPRDRATAQAQPATISRSQWGADENLRFNGSQEKCTRTFFPTQKLIVHHTVTANADPDPAATIRAIYFYHVVNRGFCDIAYNFLVDAQGQLYKGRYSGPKNTKTQDTITGENAVGNGVTGAHTGGYNSGTMGIAVLGNYVSTPIPDPARHALVQHLAWEAARHGLPPLSTSTYTNPDSGATRTTPNITGHRDYTPTECPGETLYQALPGIRQEVAALVGTVDAKPPRISGIDPKNVTQRFVIIKWRTSEPATGQLQYWEPGRKRHMTKLVSQLSRQHKAGVRGLPKDRRFRYRVFAADAAGNAAWSRPKRFSTFG